MNPGYSHSQTSASASGDTSRRPLHLVDFFCRAPQAQKVSLIGDFNGWQPEAHPMTRMPDGGWVEVLETDLQPGEPVVVEGGYNLPADTDVKVDSGAAKTESGKVP